MGGPGATDDLEAGRRTQVWLASSDEPAAKVTGEYFFHSNPRAPLPTTHNVGLQEKLLESCERFSGVVFPS
jgi:hypothetical protein